MTHFYINRLTKPTFGKNTGGVVIGNVYRAWKVWEFLLSLKLLGVFRGSRDVLRGALVEGYFGERAELFYECSLEHRGVSSFGDFGNGCDEINKLKQRVYLHEEIIGSICFQL